MILQNSVSLIIEVHSFYNKSHWNNMFACCCVWIWHGIFRNSKCESQYLLTLSSCWRINSIYTKYESNSMYVSAFFCRHECVKVSSPWIFANFGKNRKLLVKWTVWRNNALFAEFLKFHIIHILITCLPCEFDSVATLLPHKISTHTHTHTQRMIFFGKIAPVEHSDLKMLLKFMFNISSEPILMSRYLGTVEIAILGMAK